MPNSVDYRTMLTFLEFYETLLKFTLFKLYHAHGLRYPPPPASESDYLTHGRLLAIKAQALDDANDETSAAEGGGAAEDDEEEEDEEAIAGKISALPGKGAPGNAASAAAKAAAKRVKAVRKRLAKAVAMKGGSGQGNGADEEDDEGDEDEEGGDDDDDDDDEEAGGLGGASGLSRAEVNEQLEAALVAATSSSSGSLVKTDNSRSGDGESAGDAPLFAGLVFWLSRESQYAWLEFAIRCGGGGVGWAGSAIGENDPSVTHVVYDRPTAPQLTRSDVE
jgi:pescadillo protein